MSLPPWALLRVKQNKSEPVASSEIESTTTWVTPQFLHLEKHVRYYRDLMKSTEKVELSLAHSGKEEVFDSFDDPADPLRSQIAERVHTVLVPVRSDMDPRTPFTGRSGCIGTYPEYRDEIHLRDLLEKRSAAHAPTPAGSKNPSPQGSPRQSPVPMSTLGQFRPPPPPAGPKPPPPPPKAESVKKARLMAE